MTAKREGGTTLSFCRFFDGQGVEVGSPRTGKTDPEALVENGSSIV